MALDPDLAIQAGIALLTIGAVYGTVKDRVKQLVEKVDQHVKDDTAVQTKLLEGMARIEGRLNGHSVLS